MLIGNVIAFVVAIIAIKGFISLVSNRGFSIFGWYRIILAASLLYINSYVTELRFNDAIEKEKSIPNSEKKTVNQTALLLNPQSI